MQYVINRYQYVMEISMRPSSNIKYCVLSIDGGGVRGIIPARLLKEIEVRTGKQIPDLFDLALGTSTGGLIAIASACDFNSDDMIDLYQNSSAKIFPYSAMRAISTLGGLEGPKYDREALDTLLEEYFGDKLLSEANFPICVTSYNLDTAGPEIWSSQDVKKGLSADAKLKDLAGATSAAPTYFAPKEFQDCNGVVHHAIDGGMFLNNPQILAIGEILKHNPEISREDILVISIGTGNVELKWDVEALKDAGILGWVKGGRIIDVMMDGNTDFSDLTAAIVYQNYHRLQINLPKELGEMDNTSEENLTALLGKAEEYIAQNNCLFDEIAHELSCSLVSRGDVDLTEMAA
jgi:patatin-like phospholipase/acyl hydrolase